MYVKVLKTSAIISLTSRVAQLVESSPSKAMDLCLIPERVYDPEVGWSGTMFE